MTGYGMKTGTVLHFVVLPAFYQTVTFRILCVLALVAVLWLLDLLRLKQATVREFISASVHDWKSGCASRASCTTLCSRAFRDCCSASRRRRNLLPGRPDEAKKKLDHAIKQTSQAIVEGRERRSGSAFRPRAISNDLADAVRTFGDELSSSMYRHQGSRFLR